MEIELTNRLKIKGATAVGIGLNRLENAIDDSLIDCAELTATMLRVRQDAGLAAEVGHEALEHVSEGYVRLLEARRSIVSAHKALESLRRQLKLPERGDGYKLPGEPVGILKERAPTE